MLKGTLLTPFDMSPEEKRSIEARFSAMTGEKVELRLKLDKSLLGGIRVALGGRVYDGSLKGRLHHVLSVLKNGEEAGAHA